ncbi:MAG TPA: TolC family protein [Gammaproteobacteria bacterium]
MKDRIARSLLACLLLTPALSPAQTLDHDIVLPEGPEIGLSEALTRAMARNPDLRAYGYQIDAAEAQLLQAELRPYPELGVALADAVGTDTFSSFDRAEATVTLGWVLERGVRERRMDAATAGIALTNVGAELMRLDVAAETARRFIACMAFEARLLTAIEGVHFAVDTIEAVRGRIAAGRALDAELARAEADLARAELVQEDYEHELLSAYHRLSAQWGETEPDFGSVGGDVSMLPPEEPLETIVARAVQNPELARYMSEQRVYEAELRLAQARARPNWSVYGGIRRIEETDDFALVGGITIPLAVRNRNQGNIAAASANIARSEAESEATLVRVETALFVLWQELHHNYQTAMRIREDVIPPIERALADTRRAYELGRYGYFEWSSVLAELLQANNDLLEAYIAAHELIIEIERLTGVGIAAPFSAQ